MASSRAGMREAASGYSPKSKIRNRKSKIKAASSAANQRHDLHAIALLQHTLVVAFLGHQLPIDLHCTCRVAKSTSRQQLPHVAGLVQRDFFAVDADFHHLR